MLLRLLLKLEDTLPKKSAPPSEPQTLQAESQPAAAPTMMDLICSLSEADLRSIMTACLNHTKVLLHAGPHLLHLFVSHYHPGEG